MPILNIQLDQSIVDDAIDVGVGIAEAQFSKDAVLPEHVLKSAILIGLPILKKQWPRKPENPKHVDRILNQEPGQK